ncbi:MAG: ribonuclease P [Methanosarcinaceae archaeon]|nr:ribonuclease P [Methanosarcinaceae archaeon]
MKILPPTLRDTKRYLAFELVSVRPVARNDLIREIFSCASYLVGDMGSSQCGIRLLDFEGSRGVLRCLADSVELTRAILAILSSVEDEQAFVYVLGVSGTVKGATKKCLEHTGEVQAGISDTYI